MLYENNDDRRFRGRGRGARGRGAAAGRGSGRGRGRGRGKAAPIEVKEIEEGEFRVGIRQSNPDRFLLPQIFVAQDGYEERRDVSNKRKRTDSEDKRSSKKIKGTDWVAEQQQRTKTDEEVGTTIHVPLILSSARLQALWRINWEQFLKELRHSAVLEYVQQRYGQDPATIVKEVLRHVTFTHSDFMD